MILVIPVLLALVFIELGFAYSKAGESIALDSSLYQHRSAQPVRQFHRRSVWCGDVCPDEARYGTRMVNFKSIHLDSLFRGDFLDIGTLTGHSGKYLLGSHHPSQQRRI